MPRHSLVYQRKDLFLFIPCNSSNCGHLTNGLCLWLPHWWAWRHQQSVYKQEISLLERSSRAMYKIKIKYEAERKRFSKAFADLNQWSLSGFLSTDSKLRTCYNCLTGLSVTNICSIRGKFCTLRFLSIDSNANKASCIPQESNGKWISSTDAK